MKFESWKIPTEPAEIPAGLTAAGYTPLLAALLALRGISSPEKAKEFLCADAGCLSDPFSLTGMDRAAARLREAVGRREHVAVFGDYDVDGITSACLVTGYLRSKGLVCEPYIPDRIEEGYGLNLAAMDTIKSRGATLIVTVDCGITAREEAVYAAELGMDMIITDHHECGSQTLPDAVAVVDPKKPDCPDGCGGLAGVGVAFKLLCAVEGGAEPILEKYADLIATGTVADVMPLCGENRYIVRRGLEMLATSPRPGFRALLREAGAGDKRISASTVGFTLAPRLNAAGRLGHADVAASLLLAEDERTAAPLAAELCRLNRERQEIERGIWEDARRILRENPPDAPIVLASESWHQGVIGIAASKLAEEYSLPAIMICLDGDIGKGSCRSFGDFNLFDALTACSDCLEGFGGHALAAGLSIRRDRLDDFRAELADYYRAMPPAEKPSLAVSLRVDDPRLLDMDCVESLELLEPYGAGNARPTLCITDAVLDRVTPIGGGKHLRLSLRKGGRSFECVFFSHSEEELGAAAGDRVDAAFYPQINEFRGRRSVQLLITDIRRTDDSRLLDGIIGGEELTPWDSAELCPTRADFVGVWRWLERSGGFGGGPIPDIESWSPNRMLPARLFICLRVMRDSGLVSFSLTNGALAVRALERSGKADLDAHPLLRRLRSYRDLFCTGR